MSKPILCVDFDGVIHSYGSGWKGPRNIPDPPVPGALRFLAEAQQHFEVNIFSSRSNYIFGRRAMQRYLIRNYTVLGLEYSNAPEWWLKIIMQTAFADPWEDEVRWAAQGVVRRLKWPTHKPPAHLTIDDRAMRFEGVFPAPAVLKQIKPWNKV